MYKLILFTVVLQCTLSKKFEGDKPAWAKKDIRDYNDADLERLYDQWEVCAWKIGFTLRNDFKNTPIKKFFLNYLFTNCLRYFEMKIGILFSFYIS